MQENINASAQEQVQNTSFEQIYKIIYEQAKQNPVPPTDVLVNIGHSVVLMPSSKNEHLGISGSAQPIEYTGEFWRDGTPKFIRSGTQEYTPPKKLWAEEKSILGGGVIAIQGAAYLYNELAQKGSAPNLVVHTGGRPGYLEGTPENENEALYMQQAFVKSVGTNMQENTKQVLETQGKTTKDDMRISLEQAIQNRANSITIVAIGIRLPRCKAFIDELIEQNPQYANLQVNLIPAELLMQQKASQKEKGHVWQNFWDQFAGSMPYQKTYEDEKIGYENAVAKRYAGTGQT